MPSHKPTASASTSTPTSSGSGGNVVRIKPPSWTKNASTGILKTTATSLGVFPVNEIGTMCREVFDFFKAPAALETKHRDLVHQIESALELAKQAMISPQTTIDSNTMTSLRDGLEIILGEAAKIEKLRPVLKGVNKTKILETLDRLQSTLDSRKLDIAYNFAMMSMAQAVQYNQPEPLSYDEILWRDITVTDSHSYKSIEEQDPADPNLSCTKFISKARWDNQEVSFVEYSGTCSRKRKYELLKRDLKQCAPGKHINVIQLMGGAAPTTIGPHPYLVFQTGGELTYVDFLRGTTSLNALITFLKGTEGGSSWMFSQGVIYRDGISVSYDGVAKVHPPGIKLPKLTGRQSTKRWVGSILNDVTSEVQDTALPLCEIYQVLNACKSNKKLKTQIEAALVAHNVPVKKQHIFEIAESLKVPLKLTWRCETTPNCPGFVVNLASFGTF
ncbi:hypothetical protein FS749_009938, partial [Ceratobasidium sp. UAMH 11750]